MANKALPKIAVAFLLASCALLGAASHAGADTVGNTSTCMTGSVEASDDASYDEDFGADQWKDYSGVKLTSDSQKVVLSVVDDYGNSICQKSADLTTTCNFQTGFTSTFTIRVDNTQNDSRASYTICSF